MKPSIDKRGEVLLKAPRGTKLDSKQESLFPVNIHLVAKKCKRFGFIDK